MTMLDNLAPRDVVDLLVGLFKLLLCVCFQQVIPLWRANCVIFQRFKLDITCYDARGFQLSGMPYIQGDFFNWPSPENVARLAPPKMPRLAPPCFGKSKYGG